MCYTKIYLILLIILIYYKEILFYFIFIKLSIINLQYYDIFKIS